MHTSGRRKETEETIKRPKEIGQTHYVMSYWIDNIYSALGNKGDKDKSFADLERSISERDWDVHRLNVVPLMDPLRDDPRFKGLSRQMGLSSMSRELSANVTKH